MSEASPAWIFARPDSDIPLYQAGIGGSYLADEVETVRSLARRAKLADPDAQAIDRTARRLVENVRRNRRKLGGLDAFMGEYDLSSQEGIILMCLAEALLRIPDAEVADKLIADKLGDADFERHLGSSESVFVNATTWALMLTGRLVHPKSLEETGLHSQLARMVNRLGEPVVRAAMRQAMRIMAHQFVMGRTIAEALERAAGKDERRYRYSYDMLGEAALTAEDAERYMQAYADAIKTLGARPGRSADPFDAPGVSVKLSALCPRFEYSQSGRAVVELRDRVEALALGAVDAGVALTVDAEEADRLELTLEVFRGVLRAERLRDWPGLGIAVQAYQRRAHHVVEWLDSLATSMNRTIPVRLVKGAYWDTEIKRAQEQGLASYPVFTRKTSTDVCYLACARRLLAAAPHLYPQFATHNAHTVAWLLQVGAHQTFEFQRLHGMGEDLYSIVIDAEFQRPCRVYAPVGSHEDLLPYLVRRLLENGANTSFVNRIAQDDESIADIVRDPVAVTEQLHEQLRHPRIVQPRDLFGPKRRNSSGLNLADARELLPFAEALGRAADRAWRAVPIVDGRRTGGAEHTSIDPARQKRGAGQVLFADAATAMAALDAAHRFQPRWNAAPPWKRAESLKRAADLFESRRAELVALCVTEGGRTIPDSLAEVREAVDLLRYYAVQGEDLMSRPIELPGPTGERNTLRLLGRGVFLCISPWNFPVAIFTGQIAAALITGNTVIAKPAEQTSLSAGRVVELLFEAGIPPGALHFLPGAGPVIGKALLADARLAGVAFTGSTETARLIAKGLAERDGPQATLIAETGGINAMIVDSSALPEQVVRDTLTSAFNSAGQRCSALRLLCLQEEAAERIIRMLTGAMAELNIGDPRLLRTDVGPIIDSDAKESLCAYVARRRGRILYQCSLNKVPEDGLYFPPTAIEIDSARELRQEVFGPVLHVVRYRHKDLDALIDDLNAIGYGLTLGVHSRLDSCAEHIAARARVGNVYVNRNMIGAVVGVQPFGGMGLSGTGPKAGGPHYLPRFTTEQTLTINTAAVGGNAALLSLDDTGLAG
jgi:RHH-type proline utilization regulon transcriptional repressor/proline dehydrogenase/delta 1-pyrroline-5-carboxylate dehydrogenase